MRFCIGKKYNFVVRKSAPEKCVKKIQIYSMSYKKDGKKTKKMHFLC